MMANFDIQCSVVNLSYITQLKTYNSIAKKNLSKSKGEEMKGQSEAYSVLLSYLSLGNV